MIQKIITAILICLSASIFNAQAQETEDMVFTKTEKEAEFPGGLKAWAKFLGDNINAQTAVDNGAPAGSYMVIIKFIVAKDGSVTDVVAETKFGYRMEAEVIKVISKSPKWLPAIQNEKPVNAYRRQPITFVVEKQKVKRGKRKN